MGYAGAQNSPTRAPGPIGRSTPGYEGDPGDVDNEGHQGRGEERTGEEGRERKEHLGCDA